MEELLAEWLIDQSLCSRWNGRSCHAMVRQGEENQGKESAALTCDQPCYFHHRCYRGLEDDRVRGLQGYEISSHTQHRSLSAFEP